MSATSAAIRLNRHRVSVPHRVAPAPAPHIGLMVSQAARSLGAAMQELSPTSWALEIRTRSKRTQVVHLHHDRESDRVELRSVVGPYRANLGTTDLMRRTGEQALGRICVEDLLRNSGVRPYITVRHSQARTNESIDLRNAVSVIGWSADELERQLFARDVE